MTNDEIDAIILDRYRIDGYLSGEWKVCPEERAIFRAGREAAAKICESLTKRNPNGRGYITLDAIDYTDAIRAAANDQ